MSRAAVGVSGTDGIGGLLPVNDGFLATLRISRGEPPQFGADGKPVAQRSKASANSTNTAAARVSATRAVASAVAPAPAATVASAPAQQNPRTAATTTCGYRCAPAPLPASKTPKRSGPSRLRSCNSNRRDCRARVRHHGRPRVSARSRGLHDARAVHAERRAPVGPRDRRCVRCAGQRPWTHLSAGAFRCTPRITSRAARCPPAKCSPPPISSRARAIRRACRRPSSPTRRRRSARSR